MSAQQQQQPPPHPMHGIVKQVLSGDTVVIRGPPRGGPPKEKTLGLSSIIAPRLARRAAPNQEHDTKDEPYAWEAREFLRKKLIGKDVCFAVDKSPNPGKEYGTIYIGKDTSGENVTESLVAEGLVDVRKGAKSNESHQKLCQLEDNAKASGKGKHGSDASLHVRDVKWTIENPRNFMDALHQKPVAAVVEHVRDGSTVRLLLLPDYHYITLMLSGIRCPMIKQDDVEPFAEEAKFFTECRLLQRDVEVILESVSNQNFLGTILHPNGSIAELLLIKGFAKCVDWSLQCVSSGREKLRAAEARAQESYLRIWKNFLEVIDYSKEFQGKVIEVVNADSLVVKLADDSVKKICLASIRPPRLPEDKSDSQKDKARIRPLYDIPHMFEAREFLRKKLIGKKVTVAVDYKQPPSGVFAEKVCCTVTIGGVNVAEAMVSKGLSTVIRYRADDDHRSAHYDELLAAETKAQKSGKGLHNKKSSPPHRVVDLSGDLAKSKQFLPFLQRAGSMEALVEFITSGSRLRMYVPRENCLMTFLLAGISCPKPKREIKKTILKSAATIDADPWGEEALLFTREMCLQREVKIEVESMDKVGNFIGWLWIDNMNLSVLLAQEGFAEVHFSAERSPYIKALKDAQSEAQSKKSKMWESYVVPEETKEVTERTCEPKLIEITEVRPDLVFYAQHHDEGPKLVALLTELRHEFATNPPLRGAYIAQRNDICAAQFSQDGLWYRAKVDKVDGNDVAVTYVDYGNREVTTLENVAVLPTAYSRLPFASHEYSLAFINIPQDPDMAEEARCAFEDAVENASVLLNVEYRVGNTQYVTLQTAGEEKVDIGKDQVEKGYLVVDKRKEKRFQKIVSEYLAAQDQAKKNRMNLWQYGDITVDDAKEFG